MFFEKKFWVSLPPADFPSFGVNSEVCTGCGRCVDTCPIQLLTLINEKPSPNNRYDHFRCIDCQNCIAACPNNAISINGNYRVHKGFWKNSHLFNGEKTFPLHWTKIKEFESDDLVPPFTKIEEVIFNRRSVRLYRKKQVPKALVKRVIEAGRFAPSAGNNQPWKFIVLQNKKIIDEVDQKCKQFCKYVMYGTMPHPWMKKIIPGNKNAGLKWWQKLLVRALVRFRNAGEMDQRARGGINAIVSDPNYHTFFHAPTLIILLADKRGIGSVDLDLGICSQNMVLTAHSLGLGTCYVGLIDGLIGFPAFRKQLGIEEPFKIITSITLGYPIGRIDNIVKREQLRINWID